MTEKPVLDRIFDDFIKRLRESGKLGEGALKDFEHLLRRRELRPEHIKKALFVPENVE
jgi:hypothetical protein